MSYSVIVMVFKKWCDQAQQELVQLLTSDGFDVNSTPKEIYRKAPYFKDYKLDTFRSHLNKTKSKMGLSRTHTISVIFG